jgi:hypothetical protein
MSPSRGAQPLAHLATSPDVENGGYYNRFTPSPSSPQSMNVGGAKRLWDVTEELRGPFLER